MPSRRSAFAFIAGLLLLLPANVLAAGEAKTTSQNGLYPEEILTADQLKAELDLKDLLILDARNLKSYENGHIQGAQMPRPVEYFQQEELFRQGLAKTAPDQDAALVEWTKDIPKDRPIVTYCNSNCHASAVLTLRLKQLGFTRVRSMEEGYQVWEEKGYPVIKPKL